MSVRVELEDLPRQIKEWGPTAYLVTTGDRGPKIVALTVEWEDGMIVMRPGRGSLDNVAVSPAATLLWPAEGGPSDLSLLVDGEAAGDEDTGLLRFTPTSAILHVARGTV